MHTLAAFDNWIFLLLIAVAALLRLLASKTGQRKDQGSDQDQTVRRRPEQSPTRPSARSQEEQLRKFLEALGQPTSSSPPPPVAPRTNIPPRPVAPVQPPTIFPGKRKEAPKPPTKVQLPGQFSAPPYEKKTFKRPAMAPPVFEVQSGEPPEPPPVIVTPAAAFAAATRPQSEPHPVELDLLALLRSPSGLRSAIILREIFGPPRSLQPMSEIAAF